MEVRVTDPLTGGQKGQKPERYDLLPWVAVAEVAKVFHYGCGKYSVDNWRKGYAWSLSFAAMMRHATQWWEGEELDRESGYSHLAHVCWHALVLLWFVIWGKGTDDRFGRSGDE